jgi:DNA-binding transcriptional LysR family regulator
MNFKHLHYFWVTAKAGGVMRAGEQLHTTPQTLSGQIHLLEDWLGRKLFKKSGRNLELTEDGRIALGYADQIFALGTELETAVRAARGGLKVLDFSVGVADSVSKSIAYRLLEPALSISTPVRLICSEGKFPDLLAQLALNKLDLVIADEPMSRRLSVKLDPVDRPAMVVWRHSGTRDAKCAPTPEATRFRPPSRPRNKPGNPSGARGSSHLPQGDPKAWRTLADCGELSRLARRPLVCAFVTSDDAGVIDGNTCIPEPPANP